MKNIYNILIITFLLSVNDLQAQLTSTINPFIGTWEHQDGNEIFRVFLWIDNDGEYIMGHYEKVQVNNGVETFIYCSDKEKFVGNNSGWLPSVIIAGGNNQLIGGTFIDNTVDQNLYHQQKLGAVKIEIISNSGSGPITAQWTVKRGQGPYINEAPEYSVPTDIILTKVE